MADDHENFKSWFLGVLALLIPHREAGFAILLITFPLLERYLRQRAQLTSKDNLSDACMDDLLKLFPELATRDLAWQFWQVYRNGLLHELTFSRRRRGVSTILVGGVSHDISGTIVRREGSFWLHPVEFAKRVTGAIDADFATFSEDVSGESSLPKVVPLDQGTLGTSYIYFGTSGHP